MTDLRKAAEQALEALAWEEIEDAKEHLRRALAEPKRKWVGLTGEERRQIVLDDPFDWVAAVEAKLKEKNT